jgi:acyl-CoA synthetase (AMP-forming)/AMP-acid ligase II
MYGQDVSLVEINPELPDTRHVTWREYELIEASPTAQYRREITWREFDDRANRFANLLLSRGIQKGDKVAILLMNCLEWLPVYFGILKTGAVAVPLNFRYTAEEIKYCLDLSESCTLVFGPEFIGRMEGIFDQIPRVKMLFYVGENCPTFAESYDRLVPYFTAETPKLHLQDSDDAAIYFSSGTTGFPKAILHTHASLLSSCVTSRSTRTDPDDVFLCIPPSITHGAKMHWFGSRFRSRAVLCAA